MMDSRLSSLYHIPDRVVQQQIDLECPAEECAHMESRVRDVLGNLSTEERQIVETYIEIRDELEFQSVKLALKFSKYVR